VRCLSPYHQHQGYIEPIVLQYLVLLLNIPIASMGSAQMASEIQIAVDVKKKAVPL
jgi:hypothetical protein